MPLCCKSWRHLALSISVCLTFDECQTCPFFQAEWLPKKYFLVFSQFSLKKKTFSSFLLKWASLILIRKIKNVFEAADKSYTTFYICNTPMSSISWSAYPWQSLSSLVYCLWVSPGAYPSEWSTWNVHHLDRLRYYSQTLDWAGKACKEQTL
jgi:hypothetical protein